MEEALIAQKWERLTIARPSMLMGHRDERRFNESFRSAVSHSAG